MPRYVILRHELPPDAGRSSHYDLMFDTGATLRTWAVVEPPDAAREQPAEKLADHRREYLTYEGEVSGNRGTVTRYDEGEYAIVRDDARVFEVQVRGKCLRGALCITSDGACAYESEPRT